MLEKILQLSIRNRGLVLILVSLVAGLGFYSLARLPIDAVPDITNNQVQINVAYPSLSPVEIEKLCQFRIALFAF